MSLNVYSSNPKIFCIGFNKTGTTSLTKIFDKLGYKTLHSSEWVVRHKDETFISRYDFFSDGDPTKLDLEYLYTKYPTCKFIYNTRDLRRWLISRYKHVEKNKSKLDFHKRTWNSNKPTDIKMWIRSRKEWERTLDEFFQSRGRLITIDIEIDSQEEIQKKITQLLEKPVVIDKVPFFNKRTRHQTVAEENVDKILKQGFAI